MAEPQKLLLDKLISSGGFPTDYFEEEWFQIFLACQTFNRYADLADINDNIDEPFEDQVVQVTGQGSAIYKSGSWVLASDDTTLIT